MMIQENSKDITKRINSISSPKTIFIEEKTQKDQEKGENALPSDVSAPWVCY